ncbi:hypothetical protein S40285_10620 [Stachybotrys chlorohalonatus IBT 40285]|uniref:Uncharacterized protein n=1 Tax=Stachybotrys chlorohalonatus (strain IBT 40285) TaxID=1283841 RepID=A0A084QGC3_STAC4|nr:hypothetical protein S40285_10620 [Stachybotrys chlorohalonata IBT 40285]
MMSHSPEAPAAEPDTVDIHLPMFQPIRPRDAKVESQTPYVKLRINLRNSTTWAACSDTITRGYVMSLACDLLNKIMDPTIDQANLANDVKTIFGKDKLFGWAVSTNCKEVLDYLRPLLSTPEQTTCEVAAVAVYATLPKVEKAFPDAPLAVALNDLKTRRAIVNDPDVRLVLDHTIQVMTSMATMGQFSEAQALRNVHPLLSKSFGGVVRHLEGSAARLRLGH